MTPARSFWLAGVGPRARGVTVRRLLSILIGLMAGLVFILVLLRTGWLGPAAATLDPHALPTPFPAPSLTLTTHGGEPFSLQASDGVTVVFFGYASCPDVCPLTLAKLARAVDVMATNADRVRVLFVTVDPVRDTLERLSAYVTAFHPAFVGLTGSEREISEVVESWGVFREVPNEGSHYVVDHTARSFVVDGELRIRATLPADADIGEVVQTLQWVMEAG